MSQKEDENELKNISSVPNFSKYHINSFDSNNSNLNRDSDKTVGVEMLVNQSKCELEKNSTSLNSFESHLKSFNSRNCSSNKNSDKIVGKEILENDAKCELEEKENVESSSKVVVQMLPKVGLGKISALLDFDGLRMKSWKKQESTPVNNTSHLCFSQSSQTLSNQESDFEDISSLENDSIENDDFSNISSIFSDDDNLLVDSPEAENSKPNILESNKNDVQKEKNPISNNLVLSNDTNLIEKAQQSYVGNFLIYPGKGIKLGDISHIVSRINSASGQVIRILHYLLYNVYGLTGSEEALRQSKKDILMFSGFPFDEDNLNFQKKNNCLSNLPYPLLSNIYNLLINDGPLSRPDIVQALLNFLKKPSKKLNGHDSLQEETLSETEELKRKALEGKPVVKLQKLAGNFVEKMVYTELPSSQSKNSRHSHPKFQKIQLKDFPDIVTNIQTARRRIINLLHSLMYGRPGSDEKNRNNILEFSGFKIQGKNSYTRRITFLGKLKTKELWQLCETFTIRAKSGNKSAKIKKLLSFLHNPNIYFNKKKKQQNVSDFKSVNIPNVSKRLPDKVASAKSNLPVVKLADFEVICSNVECSTPEELNELNDLLFIKPCDSSEVHQKILDFTPFTFSINSMDFHYRRTLLHYMDLKVVQKIARILDIEGWETQNREQDLALKILKFLMDMKKPDKEDKKKRAILELKQKQRPHILKVHSYGNRNFNRRQYHSPEPLDSTYGSEEINDQDGHEWSSTPNHSHESAQHSRSRYRKNGLSIKHEQILNDSTPLLDFMHHPTDKELQSQIDKIINSSLSLTMGGLVKEVLNCYSNFNLQYRIDFIKTAALEILQDLRLSAISDHD